MDKNAVTIVNLSGEEESFDDLFHEWCLSIDLTSKQIFVYMISPDKSALTKLNNDFLVWLEDKRIIKKSEWNKQ